MTDATPSVVPVICFFGGEVTDGNCLVGLEMDGICLVGLFTDGSLGGTAGAFIGIFLGGVFDLFGMAGGFVGFLGDILLCGVIVFIICFYFKVY